MRMLGMDTFGHEMTYLEESGIRWPHKVHVILEINSQSLYDFILQNSAWILNLVMAQRFIIIANNSLRTQVRIPIRPSNNSKT